MKTLKKITILLIACIFFINATACGNNSWALKSDTDTLSTGVYVYFLMEAYQAATDDLLEKGISTSDIKNENIGDTKAEDWIKNRALESCKEMLAIEKLFKDMNLSLTEEETQKAQETTDEIWKTSGELYEKNLGINKESVNQAYSLLNTKKDKIFNAIYGKDGTEPVSDEELNEYYTKNYCVLKFYSKMPFENDHDESDNAEPKSPESGEKMDTNETIQKQFSEYVEAINSGTKNIDQIREDIKSTDNIQDGADPLEDQLVNTQSKDLPKEIIDAVKGLEPGKATQIKFNDIYLFLYRNPTNGNVESPDLTSEENRNKILYEMESDKFKNKIDEIKNNMNIQVNNSAINKYDLAMFNKNN